MDTIYTALRAAGCEIDSYESDLYVRDTETARTVISDWVHAGKLNWKSYSYFTCRRTNTQWIDIPFAYDPFWEQKAQERMAA